MKRIYIIFIIIIASIIALFVRNNLSEKDNDKKNATSKAAPNAELVLLNGLIRSEDGDGNLISEIGYKNGIKHGPYRIFYDNGKVEEKGKNKDGEYDGVIISYNRDGFPNQSRIFKDGVRHGLSKVFVASDGIYGNENHILETTYVNGLQHGVSRAIYMNGNIKSEQTYVNDKNEGEDVNYFKNGQTVP